MADEDVQYVINFDNYDAVLLPGNVADAIGLCRNRVHTGLTGKTTAAKTSFKTPGSLATPF